jgi:radical SAM superfamily enzyme YgiQ (UPF0313 family)
VPQGKGQDTHERPVSVCLGLGAPGVERRHSVLQAGNGARSLDATIKYPAVDGKVTLVVPASQASAEVLGVERATMEERREQTQCLSTVVAPRSRRGSTMGAPEAGRRFWLETAEGREHRGNAEFIRDTDGVADEKAKNPPCYSLSALGDEHAFPHSPGLASTRRRWTSRSLSTRAVLMPVKVNGSIPGESPGNDDTGWQRTGARMKALLVWPKFSSFSFWNFEKVCELVGVKYMTPPLGLLTIAALLPKDWELRLVDENVRPLGDEDLQWADLVMVGSKIVHRQRALGVIRQAVGSGKLVVVGGPDPTLHPAVYERAGATFLCLDEGEVTVPKLLADLARGATSGTYRADRIPDLSESPIPRFDLIDHRDYLYLGIQYSRGCPHNCEFCNVIDLFDHHYRTKRPEQVCAELDALYRLGYRGQVDFFDDNLVGHVVRAKTLLRELVSWLDAHDHPFQFSTSVTLNIARDDELLGLLRAARFKYFLVGIETPDQQALRTAAKPQNTGFSIPEAVDRIYRLAGATVHSGFLLGLDDEAADIGEQIVQCIDATSIPWVMAGVVYPLPGTQLSRRLDREKRLFPSARAFDDENVRDQISAGIQFRTQRSPSVVLEDLLRVLHHSFDAEQYFGRCAEAVVRLNTIPNLFPSLHLFLRNLRTVLRLCWRATRSPTIRMPFWRALGRVLRRNPAGMEAFATLSVLYLHFDNLLPYCEQQLRRQQTAIAEQGETRWLEERLREPSAAPLQEPAMAVQRAAGSVSYLPRTSP